MRLEGVELRWVSMPLVSPFRTSFSTQTTRDLLLLRVVTDTAAPPASAACTGLRP